MKLCDHDKEEIKNLLKWKEMYRKGKLINMENEIEIGEYIRTKRGYIRQVVRRDVDDHILLDIGFEGARYLTKVEEKEDIVKHSKNIINLVEVGDYINGYLVVAISDDGYIEIAIGDDIEQGELLTVKDIKSIVTKEQFESIKYEVE